MHANRLIPILSIGIVVLILLLLMRGCDAEDEAIRLDAVPTAPAPDADTPADTIRTLTANVAAMTAELQALSGENEDLLKENQRLATQAGDSEAALDRRISKTLQERADIDAKSQREQTEHLATLSARLDSLSAEMRSLDTPPDELPIGFGLTPDEEMSDTWHWIAPLDRIDPSTTTDNANRNSQLTPPAWPVYTVPRNATLLDATALTALVGRVPINAQVHDPMPFKVITGRDNLAANGLRVPGVSGMIWSGAAVGDWTLGCVSGRLHSVTFVFDDGTVRTVSSDTRQTADDDGNERRPLGWISDERGIPCVAGTRKTNAPQYLAQRIAVKAVEAGAEAAAAAETTTVIGSGGSVVDRVSGDIGDYVLGRTVAGGAEEIASWLDARQAQNFDAVFVAAGEKLALHIDRSIAIDYDPVGRRLTHASMHTAQPVAELD